ncbi:MAG: site-specific DNA-methyltransferase [Candidatus Portnoybacteria bacterium]|nr:site-specific DNA-methyltransferase [Candidatus Portnoybacteria bacterium]
MARRINYDNWSKEELIKELRRIKETKYGLVWHRDLPEEKIDILINPDARTPSEMFPNEMAGKPFPILKEVKSKEINDDKDKPVNLLIEGDNYHSLAVLNFTHQEAIDVIYIDPPYNTGNKDFIYNDKFVDIEDPFRHSKWLSFMEKRLKLAKNLLKKNGAIFISIDDNEQAALKMLCDEIFGFKNFIANIIWQKKYTQSNDAKYFSATHDFILCYAKDAEKLNIKLLPRTEKQDARYKNPDNDPRGPWMTQPLHAKSGSDTTYFYTFKNGVTWKPPTGTYPRFSKETLQKADQEKQIWFGAKGTAVPRLKKYLNEMKQGVIPKTIWLYSEVGSNDDARRELKELMPENGFDSPKPTLLIKRILGLASDKNSIVLDFMAGSGTTGHAVLEANKEDGGNRQFILCTNNEEIDNNGNTIKHKICSDICYPRLKKVIKGYQNARDKKIEGIGGNLKYYACDFVEAEPTDKNKRKLVSESTEMLCIRENAFDLVQDEGDFKIFKNSDKYLGIVFYEEAIGDFKKAIKKINGHFNTYVFSLGDDPHEKQFTDVKSKVTLCAIPEVILKVYREIFK